MDIEGAWNRRLRSTASTSNLPSIRQDTYIIYTYCNNYCFNATTVDLVCKSHAFKKTEELQLSCCDSAQFTVYSRVHIMHCTPYTSEKKLARIILALCYDSASFENCGSLEKLKEESELFCRGNDVGFCR
jgi:hypothetical protein